MHACVQDECELTKVVMRYPRTVLTLPCWNLRDLYDRERGLGRRIEHP